MNDRQPCYNVKSQTEKDMNKLFTFVLKVNFSFDFNSKKWNM